MELGRKPLDNMRWEELWDAALRLRSAFLTAPFPEPLADSIRDALSKVHAHIWPFLFDPQSGR